MKNGIVGSQEAAGRLLRIERIRQNREQKDVCYGICVPSYLSKIEHGTAHTDEEIIAKLYARLGIRYETDEAVLQKCGKSLEEYWYRLEYELDHTSLYREMKGQELSFRYSRYAVDWMLVQGFEGESVCGLLEQVQEGMTRRQQGYFYILTAIQSGGTARSAENRQALTLYQQASDCLQNSFAMSWLCAGYYALGDYSAIHKLEQRIVTAALEEGNTYRMAEYYMLKGSAYASLNLEELMMPCYRRSICLLQNTGWTELLSDLYYNIGATYISLKRYEEALAYLDKVEEKSFSLLQKKAVALIRMGRTAKAREILAEAEKMLSEDRGGSAQESDRLKYEEACFECEPDFLDRSEYLALLERLQEALKKECNFGHLYFYRDVIVEAYMRQRKYKKALEFEQMISSHIIK